MHHSIGRAQRGFWPERYFLVPDGQVAKAAKRALRVGVDLYSPGIPSKSPVEWPVPTGLGGKPRSQDSVEGSAWLQEAAHDQGYPPAPGGTRQERPGSRCNWLLQAGSGWARRRKRRTQGFTRGQHPYRGPGSVLEQSGRSCKSLEKTDGSF